MADETIPVSEAVEIYVRATGTSPSYTQQVLAALHEPGALPLELLGDPLPYFLKDGIPVVERVRFDALMSRVAHGNSEQNP